MSQPRKIVTIFSRVGDIAQSYFPSLKSMRPLGVAGLVTNSVFSAINRSIIGRDFKISSPADPAVWSATSLKELTDGNGRIPVESVRNSSQQYLQRLLDEIANDPKAGSTYLVVRPNGPGDPHEYQSKSSVRLSASALASLRQEVQQRPDNIIRLMMESTAMGGVFVPADRAQQIAAIQRKSIESSDLPIKQLTDADVQRSKANFANGNTLEPSLILGPFNMVRNENFTLWSTSDRIYFKFTAVTENGLHIFDAGVALHSGCLDLQTSFLHMNVIGAGVSQTSLAALGNVMSAASMWASRADMMAKVCEAANGAPLNTFDLQSKIEEIHSTLDLQNRIERTTLRYLDTLSGAVVMTTDTMYNTRDVLPNAADREITGALEASNKLLEPYYPDDMLTTLKEETDPIVEAEVVRIRSEQSPQESDSPSNSADKPDNSDVPVQDDSQKDPADTTDPTQDPLQKDPTDTTDPAQDPSTNSDVPDTAETPDPRVTVPSDADPTAAVDGTNADGARAVDAAPSAAPDPTQPGGTVGPDLVGAGVPNPADPAGMMRPGIDPSAPIDTGPSIAAPHTEPGRGFGE